MRVPFFLAFLARKRHGGSAGPAGGLAVGGLAVGGLAASGHTAAGTAASDPAAGDQPAAAPLPRRRPGSHGVTAVKVDPAAADPATLRKVLDRLNRL
jgi:hypothetical protein